MGLCLTVLICRSLLLPSLPEREGAKSLCVPTPSPLCLTRLSAFLHRPLPLPPVFSITGPRGRAEKTEEKEQEEVRWLGLLALTKLRSEGSAERPLGAGQPLTAASWANLGQGTLRRTNGRGRRQMGDKGEKNLGIPTPDPSGAQHPRHLPISPAHPTTSQV